MGTYKTEGIIIKRKNFGEADRILTIFSKNYGKISAIAKGVRKINSRRAPHLELFNQVSLLLSKGKNLDVITETQLITSFSNLKKDLKKVGLAFEACELVDQVTREGPTQEQVFNLLRMCLNDLNHLNSKGIEKVIDNFERQLLVILGFLPKNEVLSKIELSGFVEKIIEKKLKSRKMFSKV